MSVLNNETCDLSSWLETKVYYTFKKKSFFKRVNFFCNFFLKYFEKKKRKFFFFWNLRKFVGWSNFYKKKYEIQVNLMIEPATSYNVSEKLVAKRCPLGATAYPTTN